jgi:anti-sigma factor ChrR (cupin superfamily)
MTNTTKKRALGVLALVTVAALSYAAGAAKGKAAVNMPIGEMTWSPLMPGAPLNIAKLWGDRDKGEYAMLLKLPAGFEAGMHAHTLDYHAVLVQGTWVHTNEGDANPKEMAPGSYVMQPGKQMHNDQCKGTQDCIIFVHQHGKGDFIPAKPAAGAKPAEKK